MNDKNGFIPDVAYISKARMPERPPREAQIPPDLAIEVMSPTDSKKEPREKARKYPEFGTLLVWLVFPDTQTVEIYAPGQKMKLLGIDDTLDGGDVLPGFSLAVKDIFPNSNTLQ